jgi:V8-like Glu-specific endopeptidase
MKLSHAFLMLLSLTVLTLNAKANNKVIYGDDNRLDVFESTNSAHVLLSRSTAAMISGSNLRGEDGMVQVIGPSMTSRGFCAQERFSNQTTAANCSGFLVGTKYIATAGHCIRNAMDCASYKWVFDYRVENETQSQVSVPESSVYNCARIVARDLNNSNQDDYALIELDREVTDRDALQFRTSGRPRVGDELVVIGHPTGLPTKIADGAKIRSLRNKFFVANLDTYGGNSGSAVFNDSTGVVEGILVRGENDYVYDSNRGCRASNYCPDSGCRGEDVVYITNIPGLNRIR